MERAMAVRKLTLPYHFLVTFLGFQSLSNSSSLSSIMLAGVKPFAIPVK